jgi:hypothetical protein
MKNFIVKLLLVLIVFACEKSADSVGPNSNIGVGGSTARFTIAGDNLFIVDNRSLNVYSIKKLEDPIFKKKVPLNTVVETIFPMNNNLFIGTQTGMFIFNITNPENPQFVSVYSHVASCDPVVAEGDIAYVTLRTGSRCNRGENLLDIIDIKNLASPKILASYPMQNPHGLGIDGNLLFVTEGKFGLKVYDKTDPKKLVELKYFKDFEAMDVIPNEKTLIITGPNGVYQYDYSSQNNLKLLSKIAAE